jgi:hypothetical protein
MKYDPIYYVDVNIAVESASRSQFLQDFYDAIIVARRDWSTRCDLSKRFGQALCIKANDRFNKRPENTENKKLIEVLSRLTLIIRAYKHSGITETIKVNGQNFNKVYTLTEMKKGAFFETLCDLPTLCEFLENPGFDLIPLDTWAETSIMQLTEPEIKIEKLIDNFGGLSYIVY